MVKSAAEVWFCALKDIKQNKDLLQEAFTHKYNLTWLK